MVPSGKLSGWVSGTGEEEAKALQEFSAGLSVSLLAAMRNPVQDMRRSLREQVTGATTSKAAVDAGLLASALADLDKFRAYAVTPSDSFWHVALRGSARLSGSMAEVWGNALLEASETVLKPLREARVAAVKQALDQALSE